MQVEFIKNLHGLVEDGARRALLISATGTGKTYASAFGLRNESPNKILFIVHREQIARQAEHYCTKTVANIAKIPPLRPFSCISLGRYCLEQRHTPGHSSRACYHIRTDKQPIQPYFPKRGNLEGLVHTNKNI